MPNSDQLWEDMAKLESLYNELGWDPDDELRFRIIQDKDGEPFIGISNHSLWAARLYRQVNGESAIHPQDG